MWDGLRQANQLGVDAAQIRDDVLPDSSSGNMTRVFHTRHNETVWE